MWNTALVLYLALELRDTPLVETYSFHLSIQELYELCRFHGIFEIEITVIETVDCVHSNIIYVFPSAYETEFSMFLNNYAHYIMYTGIARNEKQHQIL